MDEIQRKLHRQLQTGERLAVGWGVSGYVDYQLRFSPYQFQYLVDGSGQLAGTEISGIPIISSDQLSTMDPEQHVVVVLAEWARFGQEITYQAQALGFDAIPPAVTSELARKFPEDQLNSIITKLSIDHTPELRQNNIAVLYIQNLVKGGAERQIVLLARGLTELGYQVHLVCQSQDHIATEDWHQQLKLFNVKRTTFPTPRQLWTEEPPNSEELKVLREFSSFLRVRGLHNILSMKRILDKIKPELFVSYLDDCNISSAISGIWSKQFKTLLSCRNLSPDTEAITYSNDFYITPASSLRYWYLKFYNSNRIKVYHNSIEGQISYNNWLNIAPENNVVKNATTPASIEKKSDIRSEYNLPTDSIIVVSAMRLSKEKNPLGFINLINDLKNINEKIIGILIGDGPMMEEVINARMKLNLGNSLLLTGFVNNVYTFLLDADLCVVPSFQEGSSNIVLESLTAGCPTVAYAVGGIKSLMLNEISYYLVPPENSDLLTEKCIDAINSTKTKEIFKRESQRVLMEHSIIKLAKKTIELSVNN